MSRSGLTRYTRLVVFLGFAAALEGCALNPQPEPAGGPLNPQPEPPFRGKDGGPPPGMDAGTESSDAAAPNDAAVPDGPETGPAATPQTVLRTVELPDEVEPIALTPPGRDGVSWPSTTRSRLTLDGGAQP
jgi:hypothetical protein